MQKFNKLTQIAELMTQKSLPMTQKSFFITRKSQPKFMTQNGKFIIQKSIVFIQNSTQSSIPCRFLAIVDWMGLQKLSCVVQFSTPVHVSNSWMLNNAQRTPFAAKCCAFFNIPRRLQLRRHALFPRASWLGLIVGPCWGKPQHPPLLQACAQLWQHFWQAQHHLLWRAPQIHFPLP